MDYKKIKNIIFDLGGVVIDIDFELTFKALADLSTYSLEQTKKIMADLNIWDVYERGELSDVNFIKILKKELKITANDDKVIAAWNALLLKIPRERIDLIKELNKKYNTYVLSNTSLYHIIGLNQILKDSSGELSLHEVMNNKIYFSYEINKRKPDLDIYEHIIKDAKIKAEETVFLDDNWDNIVAARETGINAIHVEVPQTIMHYLKLA